MLDAEIKWQDFALCNGLENTKEFDPFFDDYEADVVTAVQTDAMCKVCPVAKQCLKDGEQYGSWGVHGGIYLVYGRPDKQKNSHKTDDDWKELESIHGRKFR